MNWWSICVDLKFGFANEWMYFAGSGLGWGPILHMTRNFKSWDPLEHVLGVPKVVVLEIQKMRNHSYRERERNVRMESMHFRLKDAESEYIHQCRPPHQKPVTGGSTSEPKLWGQSIPAAKKCQNDQKHSEAMIILESLIFTIKINTNHQ